MQTILHAIRNAVPVLFLGYAVAANVAIFAGPGLGPVEGDLVSGEMTQRLGGLYGKAMPHRDVAVSLLGAGRYLALGEGRDGVTVGEDDWLFTDEEMTAATPQQIAAAAETIADVRDRLAGQGAELVVIPVPAKADIYREQGTPRAGAAMAAQYRRFRDELKRHGVAVVDTRPALADPARDAPVFLTRDTHWTPEGAARVADRVAASGLVPEGESDFVRTPARPEEFIGDLVSFVTADSFAPSIGLGPERVTPYVAEAEDAAEGGIFAADAGAIDTVLVGTSYSANEAWSFVPALKIALGRDILNLSEEGQGPVVPMRAFIEDPAFAEAPPRYVLWEYPIRYLGSDKIKAGKEASDA